MIGLVCNFLTDSKEKFVTSQDILLGLWIKNTDILQQQAHLETTVYKP